MRKKVIGIDEAKQRIQALVGQSLTIFVNKGRKKIVVYNGNIDGIYPSVFTLHIEGDKHLNMLSCSYSDFICGDIELKRKA